MVKDLSLREVKGSSGARIGDNSWTFPAMCLWGGRGSVRKDNGGRETCHKGEVLFVIV